MNANVRLITDDLGSFFNVKILEESGTYHDECFTMHKEYREWGTAPEDNRETWERLCQKAGFASDGAAIAALNAAIEIESWKNRLPADMCFGTFDSDFLIEGKHYQYGAWNTDGNWMLAWNTEEEFVTQLSALEFPTT